MGVGGRPPREGVRVYARRFTSSHSRNSHDVKQLYSSERREGGGVRSQPSLLQHCIVGIELVFDSVTIKYFFYSPKLENSQ